MFNLQGFDYVLMKNFVSKDKPQMKSKLIYRKTRSFMKLKSRYLQAYIYFFQ